MQLRERVFINVLRSTKALANAMLEFDVSCHRAQGLWRCSMWLTLLTMYPLCNRTMAHTSDPLSARALTLGTVRAGDVLLICN
jgi:hypothetical protein